MLSPAGNTTTTDNFENNKNTRDLEILRERVIDELLEPGIIPLQIEGLTDQIREDGSWPGINYEDTSNTGFEHSRHLSNMVILSRAYKKQGSKYYRSVELKEVIDKALNFWLIHDFICENWWWNQIGTPERMVHVLLIMDDELTEAQKTKAGAIASRANLEAWGARPGGDLIKIAGILGKYGLFIRDAALVEKVVKTMVGEIMFAADRDTPSDLRGLQTDLSFHHRHDRVTSTLSYGLGYARAFSDWAAKLSDTKFRFPDEAIELLVDFYLDGICKTMVYGKYPDPGAKNRSITRKGTLTPYSSETPEKLLMATNYRKDELKKIVGIRKGKQEPDLAWNRFYWHSEYLSHQRPHYFTSVRMFSSRNHNMEQPYNEEGLMNHHLADGSNFISRTGEEYFDIFPVYDWQKIPGTTVVQKPSLPPVNEIQKQGLTDFVGAVTDGRFGLAAFDFKSPHDPLTAKKAWFLFDREYVCLGAGIYSEAPYPVATTLNQSSLKQKVTVMQNNIQSVLTQGKAEMANVDWVFHDSIAYIFPAPANVKIQNQQAVGHWRRINRQSQYTEEEVGREVFKIWIDHGLEPQNAVYKYIVVPDIGITEIENYIKQANIEILVNSSELQAVLHKGLNIIQMVFYQPGKLKITENVQLTIDTPGLVMVTMEGTQIKNISVADPSRKLGTLHLTITGIKARDGRNFKAVWNEEKRSSDIHIDLPQDEYAGKSVIIEM